jgi:DNA processing protein
LGSFQLKKQSTSRKKTSAQRRPRGKGAYIPPPEELLRTFSLFELIGGARAIAADPQARHPSHQKLWCVGDTSLLRNKCIAIVGTREPSSEGATASRRLAQEFARAGVVVVSGLAKGIDTEALSAAIDAGGKVVAVIGTPVDRAYPAQNKRLQEQIYRQHLLVSQFAPQERVYPSNFPERNRLMAALSDATAIVEAGDTSGSLHQAAECVKLGRWLFIAKTVVEDPSLTWPRKFGHEPTVRTFASPEEVLRTVGAN